MSSRGGFVVGGGLNWLVSTPKPAAAAPRPGSRGSPIELRAAAAKSTGAPSTLVNPVVTPLATLVAGP